MPKKAKTGKSRRDKYYELAKETGYRARSAFKLLQLNRKFHFLETSRCCVDLCAAPGGWLQVCQQNMPMSSHIIGVDLVPIKPIRHCITLVEDITTDKCRAAIRKQMHTWTADVVLHDGAPNVGKNWNQDAFSQAQLTLQALKLAIGILRKGGWFVTKVFRSGDYNALIWVFRQMFKKVYATKPKASRNESAEIFVVCQHFLKPDKIDPKFTDPKFVFEVLGATERKAIDLRHPEKRSKVVEGYADDDHTQHQTLSVLDFLASENHLEQLATTSEIILDDSRISSHPLTTDEIKECCKDIKVLGKREIRLILNWRKKLNGLIHFKSTGKLPRKRRLSEEDSEEESSEDEAKSAEVPDAPDSEDEQKEIDEELKKLQEEDRKWEKKKLKKKRAEKSKYRRRLDLKMVLPGDRIDANENEEPMFKLKTLENKQQLASVEEIDLEVLDGELSDDDMNEEEDIKLRRRRAYERGGPNDYGFSSDSEEEEEEEDWDDVEEDDDSELPKKEKNTNPLIVDLEDEKTISERNTDFWFTKDSFNMLKDDDDEDVEIGRKVKEYTKEGGQIRGREPVKKQKKVATEEKYTSLKKSRDKEPAADDASSDESESSDENEPESNAEEDENQLKASMKKNAAKTGNDPDLEDSGSDSESSDDIEPEIESDVDDKDDAPFPKKKTVVNGNDKGFEVVPASHPVKRYRLDAEALAIGAALAQSRKRRREVIESAYNRYTFDDGDNLPDWFLEEEAKHNVARLPVTREEVAEQKQREMAINARPIKKVAEAKWRKKIRMEKRLEKARKKAEVVGDTDVTDKEKMKQMKGIYKKYGLLKKPKKPEATYVVARKGIAGKRVTRPAGVKGRFKMVDPRMKKEAKKNKELERKKQGKGKPQHIPRRRGGFNKRKK